MDWHEVSEDPRWANVTGRVAEFNDYFHENSKGQIEVVPLVEFLIEVRIGVNTYHSRILVHKDELDEARLGLYQFTLDKMVQQLDNYIRISQGAS